MNWEPVYALLLLTSTLITYFCALGINKCNEKIKKKIFITSSIVLNIGILFLFKYFNFIADNLYIILTKFGIEFPMPNFGLLLPVGISFYTFQAIGYSIDVYRGNVQIEKNFFRYALFVSFFPQLVAGPIERSSNLLPQFQTKHQVEYKRCMSAISLMVWGYFLKLALADRCALYVDAVFNNIDHHNGGSFLIAALLFPFQIYGDFAGYTLVAIGAAKFMGFTLMENFRRPYFSTSVTEFWRRWHISLSTWFRDYIYIPLGGNRKGKKKSYSNLLITFGVSGLWHGADWTFVIWGVFHGTILCIEKSVGFAKKKYNGARKFLHWLLTFIIVCFAWIFFRANSLGDSINIIKGIFTNFSKPYILVSDFIAIGLALMIVLVKEYKDEFGIKFHFVDSRNMFIQYSLMAVTIAYIILLGVLGGDQFIYFQF